MTYSFLNVVCTLTGPGALALNLGAGAAVAEEGITVEAVEDKNVMTIGADGQGQHSLVASDARHLTVRLFKTSPTNAVLQALFDAQSVSSALWGQNVITLRDTGRGDFLVFQSVAFKKQVPLTYAKEAGLNEWEFDAIVGNAILGS
jgi:Protein of unknown function (DUF3277)